MLRKIAWSWRGLSLGVFLCLVWACQGPQPAGAPGKDVFQGESIYKQKTETPPPADFLGPQSTRATGEQHVLVVAVRFPDVAPRVPLERIRRRVTAELNDYVRAQSYGLAWVTTDFVGWVSLPDPISAYRISSNNFEVDRGRVRKLVEDAMTAVEDRVDFKRYRNMLIVPGAVTLPGKGYGMMCYCANPGMLTGVRGNPRFVTLRSKGGREFSGGVFVGTENSPLGVFAHDFFHALGGVYADKRLVP
ncbi:MAG TPA: hypothetical protein PKY58_11245 [Syntrophales bacterium]|nr:hypothetical protein [Syntrophales bacterium]HPX12459.1 hypothetical protein [Syntrophales bacterium]HQB29423.1 hypothetical protein [Syntrophales bacterium]HQN78936.1 hypothetical protein [Syntrophales bacterium]HQQ28098.1 hypothetical protein [Syntrophales bacterium]